MTGKTRPYLFYDTTTALCTTCLRTVEAKILLAANVVYMDKWCPAHGTERVLVSDDVAYYRACREVFVKAPEMPRRFNTRMEFGCPYDCGLCPDHMQHSCLSIVEINEACNLACPICYAESGPQRTLHRPLDEVCRMLDAIVANEGDPDVVQISGGEPTLHPELFAILDQAYARPIRHVMLNTNGLRIAREPAFVEELAARYPRLELYLQFDSLEAAPLRALRGGDLRDVRAAALANLERAELSTTLVVTLRKGLNDHEVGAIIRHGLEYRCVRGVTFQPVQEAGRTTGYDRRAERLTVSEVRRLIAEQSDVFIAEDVVPVPCNPDTLAMAYALKLDAEVVPLTRMVDARTLVEGGSNTIVFENEAAMRDRVFALFSTSHSPDSQARCLSDLLCCLPQVQAPIALTYRNVFRVLIVQFMDAHSLDIRALKKSCIHFAQPDGRLIPFEAYNLFYRNGRESTLSTIRDEIAMAKARRMATPLTFRPRVPASD